MNDLKMPEISAAALTPVVVDPGAADAADTGIANTTGTQEIDTARRYASAAHAQNTRRAYASDLRRFAAWCGAGRGRVLC